MLYGLAVLILSIREMCRITGFNSIKDASRLFEMMTLAAIMVHTSAIFNGAIIVGERLCVMRRSLIGSKSNLCMSNGNAEERGNKF